MTPSAVKLVEPFPPRLVVMPGPVHRPVAPAGRLKPDWIQPVMPVYVAPFHVPTSPPATISLLFDRSILAVDATDRSLTFRTVPMSWASEAVASEAKFNAARCEELPKIALPPV